INRKKPSVVLTELQIFNRVVRAGADVGGKVVLKKAINRTDSITLDYSDNVFSLEFAAPSQFHPNKIRYQYMLEGFDREWTITRADHRRVTYTNLNPGTYVFRVKAANNDGIWNDVPTELLITVRP